MPTTINASNTTGGAVVTGDGSGVLELQSGGVTGITVNGPNVTVAGTLTATGGSQTPLVVGGTPSVGAQIRLGEATANGTNFVAVKAADNLAANTTFTLPTADGTNGQYLQTNGAGQLSFSSVVIPPSNQITAVASGTIANGATVILNADGTVSTVVGSIAGTGPTATVGASAQQMSGAYDAANNRVVVAYRNNSDSNGYAAVGTISGNTITFGTPVVFDASGGNLYNKVCYISGQQRILIVWRASASGNLSARAGQVSGTTITFGTLVTLSSNVLPLAITEVYGQSRAALLFYSFSNVGYQIVPITLSGSTVSFGSVYNQDLTGVTSANFQICSPATDRIVVAYRNGNNSQWGDAWLLTVNASTANITNNTTASFTSTALNSFNMAADPVNNRLFVFYSDGANGPNVGLMKACAVGASTLTFGSQTIITSSLTGFQTGNEPFYNQNENTSPTAFFQPTGNRVFVLYSRGSQAGIVSGVVSGSGSTSTISWDAGNAIVTGGSGSLSPVYGGSSGISVLFSANTAPVNAAVVSTGVSTLTANNFVGFSSGSFTNGQTATVQTVGAVSTNVSGLTAALKYYVLGDGSLSTTPDVRNVYAGLATSATSILVKG